MDANKRRHAGFFSWEKDRALAEIGILSVFEQALASKGQLFFSGARHCGLHNDPPDCEADDNAGGRIGFEITELVDPDSAAAARARKPYSWRDWRQCLIPELDRIIRKKDAIALGRSSYSEYVLLIHTDEPWMDIDDIRRSLSGHAFLATMTVTRAYLLLSYSPGEKGYPYIRLSIEGR